MTDKTLPAKIKERFTTTLDGDLLQKIKILAIYEKCTTNILLEEAITDLLKKYENKKNKGKNKAEWRSEFVIEQQLNEDKKTDNKKPRFSVNRGFVFCSSEAIIYYK